jgi:hypothetical protein
MNRPPHHGSATMGGVYFEANANEEGMDTISEYDKAVREVEAGRHDPRFHDLDAAIQALIADVCGAVWATPEERSQAQVLVARLEKARAGSVVSRPAAGSEGDSAEGRTTPPHSPALTTDRMSRMRERSSRQRATPASD